MGRETLTGSIIFSQTLLTDDVTPRWMTERELEAQQLSSSITRQHLRGVCLYMQSCTHMNTDWKRVHTFVIRGTRRGVKVSPGVRGALSLSFLLNMMKQAKNPSDFIDLSFLSAEEEAAIRQVLLRNEDLNRLESGRVR